MLPSLCKNKNKDNLGLVEVGTDSLQLSGYFPGREVACRGRHDAGTHAQLALICDNATFEMLFSLFPFPFLEAQTFEFDNMPPYFLILASSYRNRRKKLFHRSPFP